MKHGGDLTEAMARHGGATADWLDLSTGINPNTWPVPRDLAATLWQRLPSRAAEDALRNAAREAYGVPDGVSVAIAPGTQALIQWLPRLALPGSVAISAPTYGEHAAAWTFAGRDAICPPSMIELPAHIRHAVVVNPNNPDGRILDFATLNQLSGIVHARGGWLIVDEAFADVVPECSAVALCCDHPVIVLRSFGKFFGLAGLRLGFAIAQPAIIERIATALGPWPCSGPALAIGCAALRDRGWADRTRKALDEQARKLDEVLTAAGFAVVGGTPLFRLACHRDAQAVHALLAHRHVWCRRFDGAADRLRFGLPPDDLGLKRLAQALAEHR
jgi:cobalamin biosynthetic protein CobC